MNSIYTKSVSNVPADYNKPNSNYTKHVYIAVAGIFAFFGVYLFLTYWFLNAAYRSFISLSTSDEKLLLIGIGISSLFLGIFMIKGFFIGKSAHDSEDREIKPEDEPQLFDFLYKLADEVGAPRPHKVYLSNRVNASVFYDLSFLNLFFPSKKNLEIGLGLINVLNLGEFKAVLAHEYGHFAQRSMLVGRWVYIANQIASSIIYKRDVLDNFLRGLSSIDIRIAWIGWILSIIVWSIRSLVELVFKVVVLSQRALSREMEFQADLVAVSATGSDALIHALHKLQAADAAFSDAMNHANKELGNEKAVKDLYAIQSNAIEKTAYILNDSTYGKSPSIPEESPASFRVFSNKIAQPPKMWSTHPPDQEREENAKRNYIHGLIDDRNAWDLFKDPKKTRVLLTEDLIKTAKVKTEILSEEEAIASHNKNFDKSFFHPKYKGLYLGRGIYEDYEYSDDIYLKDMSSADLETTIKDLYPDRLIEELEDYSTLKTELEQLEAIRDNILQSTGDNGIWHRGIQIRKSELPEIINSVARELKAAKKIIKKQDSYCRTAHLNLAEKLGGNWDVYLKSLGKVIHYCEHNARNLGDAHEVLGSVLNIILADNNVSDSELQKLLISSNELYRILDTLNEQRSELELDKGVLHELDANSWSDVLEELKLPSATRENINDWVNSISSWVGSYNESLNNLRSAALETLLKTEDQVLLMHQNNQFTEAPKATKLDFTYKSFMPGSERKANVKLNVWDKFISAEGIVPAVAKFLVAATIVGATVFFSGTASKSEVSIYNGLSEVVTVDLNGSTVDVSPYSSENVSIDAVNHFMINSSLSETGTIIESFEPILASGSTHYIYNIASAAVIHEYEVYYSVNADMDPGSISINNMKWRETRADYVFTNPPETVSLSSRRTSKTKEVVEGISNIHPTSLINVLENESDRKSIIEAHVLYDASTENTNYWVALGADLDNGKDLLYKRLENYPDEIESVRALMDMFGDENKAAICNLYSEKSLKEPSNPDLKYISCRCEDEKTQASCYKEAVGKWPNHNWINFAAAYTYVQENNWELAYKTYQKVHSNSLVLKNTTAIKLERIGRLLKSKDSTIVLEDNLTSPYLDFYKATEAGIEKDPVYYSYYTLSNGNLNYARELSKKLPDAENDFKVFTAASYGANEAWVTEALSVDMDSIGDVATYSLLGLYLRKGKDINPLKNRLEQLASGEDVNIMTFVNAIKKGEYKEADKHMDKASAQMKGLLANIAYVHNSSKTPELWKTYIKTLLFASEKPYLKL